MLGVLLVGALTLLPWRSGGPAPTQGGGAGATAVQPPGAVLGVAAAVVTAALVAWLAAAVLPTRPPVRRPGGALLAGSGLASALVLGKVLTDTRHLAVGAWVSVALAAALVVLRALHRRRPG